MVVFDLETNGLLHDATRIHCVALHWCQEDITESFNDEKYAESPKDLPMGANYSITTALSYLEVADYLVAVSYTHLTLPTIYSV